MKKHNFAIIAIILNILLPPAFSKTPWLYKVTSPSGQAAWLFGSIHAGQKEMYPLDSRVINAWKQSRLLVVEMRIDKNDRDLGNLLYQLSRPTPTTAPKLSKIAGEKWDSLCMAHNIPSSLIFAQRPWATGLLLSQLQLNAVGLDPQLGIDRYFINKADAEKKIVKELETPHQQMNALASMPDTLGWKWIDQELSNWQQMNDDGQRLLQAWKSGDCNSLKKLDGINSSDSAFSRELQQWYTSNLLEHRNQLMTDSISLWTVQGHQPFVVVGAAHLCDSSGIPGLLLSKGWKINQY